MEDKFVYCKTCGAWDKAWLHADCKKNKKMLKRWQKIIKQDKIYFGYNLMPCLENSHHILQVALTKAQLTRKLKERCKDGRTARSISHRLYLLSHS